MFFPEINLTKYLNAWFRVRHTVLLIILCWFGVFLANLDAQFIFKRYLLITHKISANFRDFAGQSQKLHGLINVLKARRPRHSQKLHCLINVFKDDKSFTKTIGEAYNFSKILNHLSATGSRMEQSIEAQNKYSRQLFTRKHQHAYAYFT